MTAGTRQPYLKRGVSKTREKRYKSRDVKMFAGGGGLRYPDPRRWRRA